MGMRLSKKTENEILNLHREGLWSREIARRTQVSYGGVQHVLIRYSLTPNLKNYKVEMEGKKIICGTCRVPKMPSGFYKKTGFRYCKICFVKKRNTRLNSSLLDYFRERCTLLRKRKYKMDVTPQFLLALWEKQDGKCLYTDVPMSHEVGRGKVMDAVSVDRVDATKGYTQDNVVLCTLKANMVKTNLSLEELQIWIPSWHQRLVDSGLIIR